MENRGELLSISEMAKLRKVTTETLRHYDRIGLFKPVYKDPLSGYRYYSITQYETLGTIKELRQLGMQLEEIKDYFEERTVHKSLEILEHRHELLIKEIQQKNALEKIIAEKICFMREMEKKPRQMLVEEKQLEKRYIIATEEIRPSTQALSYKITELESSMNEVAPVLASNRVGAYSNAGIDEIQDDFQVAPFILCDRKYKNSKYFMEIQGGRYLSIYYNGRFGRKADAITQVADYMKKNHLIQNGPFLQIYEIDITVTSNFEETMLELQVPVR